MHPQSRKNCFQIPVNGKNINNNPCGQSKHEKITYVLKLMEFLETELDKRPNNTKAQDYRVALRDLRTYISGRSTEYTLWKCGKYLNEMKKKILHMKRRLNGPSPISPNSTVVQVDFRNDDCLLMGPNGSKTIFPCDQPDSTVHEVLHAAVSRNQNKQLPRTSEESEVTSSNRDRAKFNQVVDLSELSSNLIKHSTFLDGDECVNFPKSISNSKSNILQDNTSSVSTLVPPRLPQSLTIRGLLSSSYDRSLNEKSVPQPVLPPVHSDSYSCKLTAPPASDYSVIDMDVKLCSSIDVNAVNKILGDEGNNKLLNKSGDVLNASEVDTITSRNVTRDTRIAAYSESDEDVDDNAEEYEQRVRAMIESDSNESFDEIDLVLSPETPNEFSTGLPSTKLLPEPPVVVKKSDHVPRSSLRSKISEQLKVMFRGGDTGIIKPSLKQLRNPAPTESATSTCAHSRSSEMSESSSRDGSCDKMSLVTSHTEDDRAFIGVPSGSKTAGVQAFKTIHSLKSGHSSALLQPYKSDPLDGKRNRSSSDKKNNSRHGSSIERSSSSDSRDGRYGNGTNEKKIPVRRIPEGEVRRQSAEYVTFYANNAGSETDAGSREKSKSKLTAFNIRKHLVHTPTIANKHPKSISLSEDKKSDQRNIPKKNKLKESGKSAEPMVQDLDLLEDKVDRMFHQNLNSKRDVCSCAIDVVLVEEAKAQEEKIQSLNTHKSDATEKACGSSTEKSSESKRKDSNLKNIRDPVLLASKATLSELQEMITKEKDEAELKIYVDALQIKLSSHPSNLNRHIKTSEVGSTTSNATGESVVSSTVSRTPSIRVNSSEGVQPAMVLNDNRSEELDTRIGNEKVRSVSSDLKKTSEVVMVTEEKQVAVPPVKQPPREEDEMPVVKKKKLNRELESLHNDLFMIQTTKKDKFLPTESVRSCRQQKSTTWSLVQPKPPVIESDDEISSNGSRRVSVQDFPIELTDTSSVTGIKRKRGRPKLYTKRMKIVDTKEERKFAPEGMRSIRKACPLSVKIKHAESERKGLDRTRCYDVQVVLYRLSEERIRMAANFSTVFELGNDEMESDAGPTNQKTNFGKYDKKSSKHRKRKKSKELESPPAEAKQNVCVEKYGMKENIVVEQQGPTMDSINAKIQKLPVRDFIRGGLKSLQISFIKIDCTDGKLVYRCESSCPECAYFSADAHMYAHHLSFNHEKRKWNGNCPYCNDIIQEDGADIIDALSHLLNEHLMDELEADLISEPGSSPHREEIDEAETCDNDTTDVGKAVAADTIEQIILRLEEYSPEESVEQNVETILATLDNCDLELPSADLDKLADIPITESYDDSSKSSINSIAKDTRSLPVENSIEEHTTRESISDEKSTNSERNYKQVEETESAVKISSAPRIRVRHIEGDRLSKSFTNYSDIDVTYSEATRESLPNVISEVRLAPPQILEGHVNVNDSIKFVETKISSDDTFTIESIQQCINASGTEDERNMMKFYKCSGTTNGTCTFTTNSMSAFKEHLCKFHKLIKKNKKIQYQLLQCIYCASGSYSFNTFEDLEHHLKTVHKFCDYQCPYCLYRASRPVLVIWHLSHKHPTENSRILISSLKDNRNELLQHSAEMFSEDFIQPFTCTSGCQFSTQSRFKFINHTKEVHGSVSTWSCANCVQEIFVSLDGLLKHLSMIHGMADFQCLYCKYGAAFPGHMQTHLTQNHSHLYPRYAARAIEPKYDAGQDVLSYVNIEDLDSSWHTFLKNYVYIDSDKPENPDGNSSTSIVTSQNITNSSSSSPGGLGDPVSNNESPTQNDEGRSTEETHSKLTLRGAVKKLPQCRKNVITGLSGHDLYRCGVRECKFSSADKNSLKDHIMICDLSRHSDDIQCPHCRNLFKSTMKFLFHLNAVHGPHLYWCFMCDYKRPLQNYVVNHVASKHKVIQTKIIPVNKMDVDSAYIVIPHEKQYNTGKCNKKSAGTVSTSHTSITTCSLQTSSTTKEFDSSKKESFTKVVYSLEDLNTMKLGPVLTDPIVCGLCISYETKVRSNMVNHMRMHEVGIASIKNIVNPVPKKADSERMFYQAANHAAYTMKDSEKEETVRSTGEMENTDDGRIPVFVPRLIRSRCGAVNCNYISQEATMLKVHFETVHPTAITFPCPHCPRSIPIPKIPIHLKYHGARLYKCPKCDFIHYQKNAVEIHISKKHDNAFSNKIITIRELRKVEEDEYEGQVRLNIDFRDSRSNFGRANGIHKMWKCTLCYNIFTPTEAQMKKHSCSIHGCENRYKCCVCLFSHDSAEVMDDHISSNHENQSVFKVTIYKKVEEIPIEMAPQLSSPGPEQIQLKEGVETNQNNDTCYQLNAQNRRTNDVCILPSNSTPDETRAVLPNVKVFHNINENKSMVVEPYPSGEYRCPFCTSFRCSSSEAMRDHIFTERNYLRFFCLKCGEEAVHKADLEIHLMDHTTHPPNSNYIRPYTNNESFEKKVQQSLDYQKEKIDRDIDRRNIHLNVDTIYICDTSDEEDSPSQIENTLPQNASSESSNKSGSSFFFSDESTNKNKISAFSTNDCNGSEDSPSFTRLELRKHENDVQQFDCLRCGEVFKGVNSYIKHLHSSMENDCVKKTNSENVPCVMAVIIRCPFCGYKSHGNEYSNYLDIIDHIKKVHLTRGNPKNTSIIIQVGKSQPRNLVNEEVELIKKSYKDESQTKCVSSFVCNSRRVAMKSTSKQRKPLNVHNPVEEI